MFGQEELEESMLRFSEKVEELIREEESKKEQENNEGEDLSDR
mgnify:CR=1 FL=1